MVVNSCIVVMSLLFFIGFTFKMKTIKKDRKKGLKRVFFPFVNQISFGLIVLIGSFLGIFLGIDYVVSKFNYLEIDGIIIIAISIAILSIVTRITFNMFIVSVPAFTGLVTESLLGGEYFTYPMGIHIRYPWEIAKLDNYFSLEIITVSFFETFVASDGGVVVAKGSFRYHADFENLVNYARIAESTIVVVFTNLAKGLLTSEIASRDTDKVRKDTSEIKKAIEELYKEKDGQPKRTYGDEKIFGVQFEDFTLADIDYDDKTQNILTAEFNRKVIARTTDFNTLDPKDREDAMILQGTINKNINKIDITGIEGVAPAIAGGIAAVTQSFLKKEGTKNKTISENKDNKKGGK